MSISDFRVSGANLFPIIEEMLAKGKPVRFTVSGNSMWPLISHNRDSVLLVPCDKENLKKGDIILFRRSESRYVLHRITEVKEGGYITTGDGNCHRDGFVPYNAVCARASKVYHKDRTIECDRWYWKTVFGVWMAAFPVRRFLMRILIKLCFYGKEKR